MPHSIKIGITDCGKFDNYRRWIEIVAGFEVVKLSMHLQNAGETDKCDGILFSGGEDLHPGLYGCPEYVNQFGLKEIIPARDEFEYLVIEKALNAKKPVLGICRGLQLINVFLGGTLVPDIPSIHQSQVHGKIAGTDQVHSIRVVPGSLLQTICRQETGMVNSAHHQSVGQAANLLKISAWNEPHMVEAMEWKDPREKSWLLMVQWHPERMQDTGSPLSFLVRTAFLEASKTAGTIQQEMKTPEKDTGKPLYSATF